jgi:RNA polymerase sigma factor (sigma-70 family)
LYGFAMTIALRFAHDEQDAGVIMSHAFVKLFRSLYKFDAVKGSIYSWVKKIVTNEALDHIKQRARFSTMELDKADEPQISNTIIEKTDVAEIMLLIRQLPPATHAVFVLYAVEGYAHKEIAAQLGISEGTSKWHLSEARKNLQQKLQHLNR